MKKSNTLIISLLLMVVALIALYLTSNSTSSVPLTENQTTLETKVTDAIAPHEMWVKPHSPILGPKKAPITLVEFIDPACEACRAMYPYVKQIMKTYPDDVRLVIRYVNFHEQSEQAIRILEAARKQGQFNTTLEVLLAFQPAWAPHHKEGVDPWTFISKTALDIEKAKKEAQGSDIAKIIELDMADVEAAGVKKTPSFFVNGKPLKLMHPDPLLEMIEAELKAIK